MIEKYLPWLTAAFLLAVWEIMTRLFAVPAVILPPPSNIAGIFVSDKVLLIMDNAVPTTIQVLAGFLIAIVVAVLMAMVFSYFDRVRQAVVPYIIAFQVIPKIALAPVFILWFGIGFMSRFAFVVFMCFFPIVISMAAGLREADAGIVKMCRSLGCTRLQILFLVRLPFSAPYLFSSLKTATTMALIGVIVSEFITADRGLGYLILWSASRLDTTLLMASIVMCCAIGVVIYGFVSLAERVVLRRLSMR